MTTIALETTNAAALSAGMFASRPLSVCPTDWRFASQTSAETLSLVLLSLVLFDPTLYSFAASEKPGLCPRARWGSGVCAEHCYDDSDCPGKEKCCSSGCGHKCIAPFTGLASKQISML